MSSSDSRSDSEGFDPNEALSRRDPEYFADQMPERPNRKHKVRISLNQSPQPALAGLIRELKELHNMTLKPSGDIVTISGILPDNNFDRQQLLDIVRKHVPSAAFAVA